MITLKDYSRENEEAQYYLTTSEGQAFAFSNFDDLTNDLEIFTFGEVETQHGMLKDLKTTDKEGKIVQGYTLEDWKVTDANVRTKGNEETRKGTEKGVRSFSN
jgi:hypothetical protein